VTTEHEGDAIYAPGYSEEERQRLIEQASFFGGFTERFSWTRASAPDMRAERPIGGGPDFPVTVG
jgi:hypothetical protein